MNRSRAQEVRIIRDLHATTHMCLNSEGLINHVVQIAASTSIFSPACEIKLYGRFNKSPVEIIFSIRVVCYVSHLF